jgi:hypothetical protein
VLPPPLYAEFASRALAPETLFLLSARDALALIDRCLLEGYAVLGVEGFQLTNHGAYQPDQRYSNDIANGAMDPASFLTSTKQLISSGESIGIRYQVVVDAHKSRNSGSQG